jgi:Fe-S-cluster-containing hydrogenase component 2
MCPNGAIQTGRKLYWIDPLLCTECALYAGEPQCAAKCLQGAIFATSRESAVRAIHPLLWKKRARGERPEAAACEPPGE